MYYLPYWPYWRYFQQSPSILVVGRVSYCQEVPYVLPYWPYWRYFQQSPSILVSRNDPSCVCRCQYNYIYFRELFLAAHFSRKFEKPSYGSEGSFLTLRTNDIVHFATYLLSKIVLYIIYVIICTYMGINWHRRQQPMCLIYVGVNGTNCTYGLTSKQNKAHIYVGTVMEL